MAVQIVKTRVHNPRKSLRGSSAAKSRNSKGRATGKPSNNPGILALVGPVNPYKGATKMAKTKKAKKASRNPQSAKPGGVGSRPRRKKSNPAMHAKRGRRRNPPKLLSRTGDIFQLGFWVVVGLVLTRQLPQLLLGAKNTGTMGYFANFITAIVSAWAANSVGGERAAMGAGAGGGAYVITRVAQEQFNPIGKYLSLQGLGDAMSLGEILTGDRTYFPLPLTYDNNRNPIIPQQIRAVPPPVSAAALPPASLGNYRRRVAM